MVRYRKMKKLLIFITLLLLLIGCSTDKKEETVSLKLEDLNIVSPKGAPVLAFYNQIENERYTRVTADAINALWSGDNSPEVIVVDLTSGINAINNGANYKLGAVITFGNFYLGATGNDESNELDKEDTVVLFGNENQLPNKLWHYLYGNEYDEKLIFVQDAQQAAAALTSGKDLEGNDVDYVFLAQPALFAALKNNDKASVYADIQKQYKDKTGLDMIQAAVFVKDGIGDDVTTEFLNNLETSINDAINDPEKVVQGLSVYKDDEALAQYGFNPNVVVNVFKQKNALGINAMGLGYKKAIDIKADIDAFLDVIGVAKTDEKIYFK